MTMLKTDLTIDGAWHDMNLSGIVPAGAKAILLEGDIEASSVGYNIKFRKTEILIQLTMQAWKH